MTLTLTRRAALTGGIALTFAGSAAFAAADADLAKRKLVVVIARGGMDGLSVAPPLNDANYQALRGEIAIPPGQALKLTADFGLHPRLQAIHALAMKSQARIAPAIAVPERARSHFEAQDVLEGGGTAVYGLNSGWLNRAVGALSARKVEALSIGPQAPLILRGPTQAASWSPGPVNRGERLPMVLADLYADDPLLSRALASGLETETMAQTATGGMGPAGGRQQNPGDARAMGRAAAGFMTQPGGPQMVALSIEGWDTHANQGGVDGQLANRLANLDGLIDGLAGGLGEEWKNTVVVVVTEFGRTAKVNGTRGTDHGTASTALVLGGGLKAGGVIGDWPTLAAGKLYEGRDLAPTLDMRALFKSILADHMGVDRRALDTTVFPDSARAGVVTSLV